MVEVVEALCVKDTGLFSLQTRFFDSNYCFCIALYVEGVATVSLQKIFQIRCLWIFLGWLQY
ncbi:MAG TPA: hypothetical protein DCW29_06355 [Janthinobacterium sp.]|nr:hypothetical protein [Janthinobacterium sp.]